MSYLDKVERVKQLKREKRHDEAIALLLEAVAEVEVEAAAMGGGWTPAPWYYRHLAIVYRKEKRYADELAILHRYKHLPDAIPYDNGDTFGRHDRAHELAAKHGVTDADMREAFDNQNAAIRGRMKRPIRVPCAPPQAAAPRQPQQKGSASPSPYSRAFVVITGGIFVALLFIAMCSNVT